MHDFVALAAAEEKLPGGGGQGLFSCGQKLDRSPQKIAAPSRPSCRWQRGVLRPADRQCDENICSYPASSSPQHELGKASAKYVVQYQGDTAVRSKRGLPQERHNSTFFGPDDLDRLHGHWVHNSLITGVLTVRDKTVTPSTGPPLEFKIFKNVVSYLGYLAIRERSSEHLITWVKGTGEDRRFWEWHRYGAAAMTPDKPCAREDRTGRSRRDVQAKLESSGNNSNLASAVHPGGDSNTSHSKARLAPQNPGEDQPALRDDARIHYEVPFEVFTSNNQTSKRKFTDEENIEISPRRKKARTKKDLIAERWSIKELQPNNHKLRKLEITHLTPTQNTRLDKGDNIKHKRTQENSRKSRKAEKAELASMEDVKGSQDAAQEKLDDDLLCGAASKSGGTSNISEVAAAVMLGAAPTMENLRAKLKELGLKSSRGNKVELIARLEEHTAKNNIEMVKQPPNGENVLGIKKEEIDAEQPVTQEMFLDTKEESPEHEEAVQLKMEEQPLNSSEDSAEQEEDSRVGDAAPLCHTGTPSSDDGWSQTSNMSALTLRNVKKKVCDKTSLMQEEEYIKARQALAESGQIHNDGVSSSRRDRQIAKALAKLKVIAKHIGETMVAGGVQQLNDASISLSMAIASAQELGALEGDLQEFQETEEKIQIEVAERIQALTRLTEVEEHLQNAIMSQSEGISTENVLNKAKALFDQANKAALEAGASDIDVQEYKARHLKRLQEFKYQRDGHSLWQKNLANQEAHKRAQEEARLRLSKK